MLPGNLVPAISGMAQVAGGMIMAGRGYIDMTAQAGSPDAFEDTGNVTLHALDGCMRPAQGVIGACVLAAAGESSDPRRIPG